MQIDNVKYNNLFVTNIDDIFKILMEEEIIFLYDTVSISHHEVAFKRHEENLLKTYSRNHPIILTESIIKELRMEEDTDRRYENFLKEFPLVIGIAEEDFPILLEKVFQSPQHVFAKCRDSAVTAFQSIYELSLLFKQQINYPDILNIYHEYFNENDNKGEYSLLWLSVISRMVNPSLNVHFVGMDRDLYSIVYHYYYRTDSLEQQLRKSRGSVEIVSTDSLLYGLTNQDTFTKEVVEDLCTIYRKPERKVIYKKVKLGIPSHNLHEGQFNNISFIAASYQREIVVVY